MPNIYAVIGSINTASRLKKELEAYGIRSHIVPTPNSSSGCSYSLLIHQSSKSDVMQLARRYNIKKFIDDSGDII